MKKVDSQVEFIHNGEEIKATLSTYYDKGIERHSTIMFNYKDINVHISLDEDEKYYFVAPLHCRVLDKLGLDGYKKYEKYLSDIRTIEHNYIVVNDKVYNYYSKLISSSPKYYVVRLKMADGNYLDGTYKFMTVQDHGDKRMLLKNLQYQAQNYFKENKIEPAIECLNQEKTEEYQKKKKWINEVHESL
ncbi:hypothetical protein PNH38_02475 [Anoxybacillus rupiensis]|uniref:Uncharacterized protein n=1 Tax=Anoxybacteroides rupiense TaxID=311460 RepID=A0ABT5W0A7_9BACL|nr:hypothetical protein [Anoxybacillus rupiensis]MDE8562746.1 hypothetical protein [Anoxybacillus rupiensis]